MKGARFVRGGAHGRQRGKISNANLALLIGLISAGVFIVSLFKLRPF